MIQSGYSQKLSGADKFQLLLDWQIRSSLSKHAGKDSREGNVIRMSIEVNGKIELNSLQQVIDLPFLTQINSLQIKTGFLQSPAWNYNRLSNPVEITEHHVNENSFIPDEVFKRDITISSGKLIHIDLVQGKTNSILVFSAHHALADNQGIQSLIKTIGGSLKPGDTPFSVEPDNGLTFVQQLLHVLKATLLIFRKSPLRLAKLPQTGISKTAFSVLRFSKDQTEKIESLAVKNGARLSKSVFYLAATTKAMRETFFAAERKSFLVVAPQNQRLRGTKNMALGNRISFLFYNIPFKELDKTDNATAFISKQMMEQAKQEMPKSYSHFMSAVRFLPLPVYNFFYKLPTLGAVSSFLFSDVGDTLQGMETFMGKEILEVLNFPPNACPPGLIIVFMKHGGAYKVITTYNSKAISKEEISKFETALTLLLLQ